VTVTAGLAILVYAIVDAERAGWGSTRTIVLGVLAASLLATFVFVESRSRGPLMPLATFRLRTLRGANVVALMIGMSLFSMFYFVSLYLQQVLRYDALEAGFAYLPLSIAIIVSAGVASQLVTRVGFKVVLIAGLLCVAAGLLWFSRVSADGGYASDVLGPSLLAAVGLGLSFVPVTIAAMTGTREDQAGIASGLITTSQQVGGALGVAILAAVASGVSGAVDPRAGLGPAQLADLTDGFRAAFLVGAAIALLGALAATLLISSRDSRRMAEAARAGESTPAPAA
jgi:predicted MFS family arabinose efflux permease